MTPHKNIPQLLTEPFAFVTDGRQYLLQRNVTSKTLQVLGELPVPHPDDPGSASNYGDYLRWLAAEHVIAPDGRRLAVVAEAEARDIAARYAESDSIELGK